MNNINPNILKAVIGGAVIVSAVAISTVAYYAAKFDWSSILSFDPKNESFSPVIKESFSPVIINMNQFYDDDSPLIGGSSKANTLHVKTLINSKPAQYSAVVLDEDMNKDMNKGP